MRAWIVPTLVVCGVLVLLYFVLVTDDKPPNDPTKGVEISVESGEVAFSNDMQRETVATGQTARVDSNGVLAIAPTPETGAETPLPDVPDKAEDISEVTQTGSKPADEKIEYGTKEGFWITGFVKTQDGYFVPGAKITAERKEEKTLRGYKYKETVATFEGASDDHGYYEVQSDTPGHYALRSHVPSQFGEYLDAFGKVDLNTKEKTALLDLVHRPGSGYWILGTVKTEDGQPVQNSHIFATEDTLGGGALFETNSDDEGGYAIKVGGPGGRTGYFVRSNPPGDYLPARGKAYFKGTSKQEWVELVHIPGGLIVKGCVIDKETSEPIAKAHVGLLGALYGLPPETHVSNLTDENGEFTIRATKGDYFVYAQAQGYVTYYAIYEAENDPLARLTVDENTAQNEIIIRLDPGLAAKFLVTSAEGIPVEGAQVNTRTAGWGGGAVTGKNGECLIDTMPKGLAVAEVEKRWDDDTEERRHVSKAFSEPFEPSPADNPTIVRVTLAESASVSGRVTYKDTGEPVKNREMSIGFDLVNAVMGRSSNVSGPETDDDGYYKLETLAPGNYSVSVERESSSHNFAPKRITLKPGEDLTGVDFAIDRGSEANEVLRGRVVNDAGEPIAEARLHLIMWDPQDRDHQISKLERTDDDGEFEIAGLVKADRFRLFVRAS
ncbi:MAG: hypothetical protein ABIH23_04515, partial [bacterium]